VEVGSVVEREGMANWIRRNEEQFWQPLGFGEDVCPERE